MLCLVTFFNIHATKSTLVQVMAWHRAGDKPLPEQIIPPMLMHIHVIRLQSFHIKMIENDGLHSANLYGKMDFNRYNRMLAYICSPVKAVKYRWDLYVPSLRAYRSMDTDVNVAEFLRLLVNLTDANVKLWKMRISIWILSGKPLLRILIFTFNWLQSLS